MMRSKISQVCNEPANFEEEVVTAERRYKEAEKSVAGSASFQYLYEKWRDKVLLTSVFVVMATPK